MKNIIKIIALISCMFPTISNASESMSKSELRFVEKIMSATSGEKSLDNLINRYGFDLLFNSLNSYAKSETGESDVKRIDDAVFNLLVKKHPTLDARWEKNTEFSGVKIYQDDTLFDVKRVKYSTPEFNTFEHGSTIQLDGSVPVFENEIPTTSYHKMMKGEPATGPDGRDIVVCRLTNLSDANYYEISQVDAKNMLRIIKSDMSLNEACLLNNQYIREYWLNRSGDFTY